MAVTAGRAAPYYPSDKTFTTRLRNVEFGHDYMTLNEYTPRMKPDAKQYPEGTRMNWVTFQVSFKLSKQNYKYIEQKLIWKVQVQLNVMSRRSDGFFY